MTNREKYQEQIDRFIMNHAALVDGKFHLCVDGVCNGCDFLRMNGGGKTCFQTIEEWLDKEAEE